MKKIQTSSSWFGPFEQIDITDDSYICDGCVFPFNVIGEAEILDYDSSVDQRPSVTEEQETVVKQSVKDYAHQLLLETDWVENPSVSNSSLEVYLTNKNDFDTYRLALRMLAVNPTISPTWPIKPKATWSL